MANNELSAALPALVDHAKERYEDSVLCDAVRYFIMDVGAIPDYVWGKMPWTGRWRQNWATARDARLTEATTMRDRLGETAGGLLQVAADYSGTDIDVSLDFDISKENAGLQPFLQSVNRTDGHARAHPGGHAGAPPYFPGGTYVLNFPSDTPDGQRLNYLWEDGTLNVPQIKNPGSVTSKDRAWAYFATPGRQELWKFINEHYPTLKEAEKVVAAIGPLPKSPTDDFIDEAKDAWPGVIINRADLLHVAQNNYTEMRNEMAVETDQLKSYWWSPGGSEAYFIHANTVLKYLDTVGGEMNWLAEEGKKAGRAIDSLQLAYAKAGYNKIGTIIDQLKAYKDAVNSLFGCPDDPAKALLAALNALADMMFADWKAENENAKTMLNITETAMSNAPDLGSSAHDAKPFPQASGGSGWQNGHSWKPGQRSVPAPTA
jgi:hypothetical protein